MSKVTSLIDTRSEETLSLEELGLIVTYSEGKYMISFDRDVVLDLTSLKILTKGDLELELGGELGLTTEGENICLDSIGGKFFINSRMSKRIQDLPESIEFREDKDRERRKMEEESAKERKEYQLFIEDLVDRVEKLEAGQYK